MKIFVSDLDELALFEERVLPTNQSEDSQRLIDAAPRPPKDQRSPKDRDLRSQDRYPRSKDPILSMDRDSRSRSKDPILSMERDERSRSRGLSQPKSDSDAPGKELKQSKAKVPVVTGLDNIDSPDLIGAEPISPPRPNEGVSNTIVICLTLISLQKARCCHSRVSIFQYPSVENRQFNQSSKLK